MSTFRVHKSRNYTVMSNHHLQNDDLSLRAMGLLSYMLSKPDDWNFSVEGIAAKCRDGKDSVRSAVRELEENGYIVRRQRVRDQSGHLKEAVYDVYESPDENPDFESKDEPLKKTVVHLPPKNQAQKRKITTNKPMAEKPPLDRAEENLPMADFPPLVNPTQAKPALLNTNIPSTNILNTNLSINHSNNNKYKIHIPQKNDVIDEIDYNAHKCVAMEQIDFARLSVDYTTEQIDEIVDLMAFVYSTPQSALPIGGVQTDIQLIRQRFFRLDYGHIQYVLDCVAQTQTKISNRRNYMLTCLFSAPVTMDGYYANQVAHDLSSG